MGKIVYWLKDFIEEQIAKTKGKGSVQAKQLLSADLEKLNGSVSF